MTYILPTLMAWAAYLAWERHMDCDCGAHLERNSLGYFDCVFCGVSW